MGWIINKFRTLKSFNFSLFIALCALSLVPAIYQTIRTFIISTNTSTSGIDIIGQMEWFDLIDETIKAFLIIPLYAVLNKIFQKNKETFAHSVFKTGLITFLIYLIFSVIVFFYGLYLIKYMNQSGADIALINHYLQMETIAFAIGIIESFVTVVFVVIGKAKNMYIFLVVHALLSVIADFLLIPNTGVLGVAYSNIMINSVMAIAGIIILFYEGYIHIARFNKADLPIVKSWAEIGLFSGIQQFIDNIVYALMIAKMVNMVAQQGNYWVANNFIWGWQ